jgi:nucleoside-diphosphate-sugar epimerase
VSQICVTGGCGYVGSALVPALLERGHTVTVLDLMLFGNHLQPHPNLTVVEGDIRHLPAAVTSGSFDAVVHLACIANDPSWALDPELGKSINYDALEPLVTWAKKSGVQRFVYASSSSVYGTMPDGVEVTEDLECKPLTDYSKYKYLGEQAVLHKSFLQRLRDWWHGQPTGMIATVLRPATVCGYSSRLRLDVVVNQMTIDALTKGEITVHSAHLYRAHLHIQDMVRAYQAVLQAPALEVEGRIFNVGGENLQIGELAKKVRLQTGATITDHAVTNDPRSYTLNSDKIRHVLLFAPLSTVDEAIVDVCVAVRDGKVPNPTDTHYHNIRRMQELVEGQCLAS